MRIRTHILLLIGAASLALAGGGARADEDAAAYSAKPVAPARPLDLRPPDITELYTQQQLAELIEKLEKEHLEGVEVEGARVPQPTFTPHVWPAIAAPFWALLHPTQAWRIFLPLPPDQANNLDNRPPDTEGYLEPIGVPPGPFDR